MRQSAIVLALIACTFCAPGWKRFGIDHSTAEHAGPSEYEFVVTESPSEPRFDVVFLSRSDRPLCIHQHSWPNSLGQLHFAGDHVFVLINGVQYPIQDRNFGYCSPTTKYGCYHRVRPGAELRGFVAFSEFDPQVRESQSRRLDFSIGAPAVCE